MKKILLATLFLFLISNNAFAHRTVVLNVNGAPSSNACPIPSGGSKQLKCSTYYQTTNYTCGPAAVMTLMNFYGKLNRGEMNKVTELRIAGEMGAVTGSSGGTSVSDMESWLGSHGFSASSGRGVSSGDIIANIDRGEPTLIAYNNHWILAKGYKPGTGSDGKQTTMIIFSDSCCGTNVIAANTIDSAWQEGSLYPKMCGSNVGNYIVATPN